MSQNKKQQLAGIPKMNQTMIVEGAVLQVVAPIRGSDRAPFAAICG